MLFLGTISSDISNFIGIPAGITGIGIPLWLWLTGKIKLTSDYIRELNEARERVKYYITDRDAWKVAHDEQVNARIAAERATAALIEHANLSSQLLEALQLELRRTHDR